MNEFLTQRPFDLYELHLFETVAASGSFTRAGEALRMTQSAVTRQIQGLEEQLGIALFERTTRHVRLTEAGQRLRTHAGRLLTAATDAYTDLRRSAGLTPTSLRVGICPSIGLAYLPGFFFAFRRECPRVQLIVSQEATERLLEDLESGRLDVALLSPPQKLPRTVQVTHRFQDAFLLITPPSVRSPELAREPSLLKLRNSLSDPRWLLPGAESTDGRKLQTWLRDQGWPIEPAMELANYDMIVNLVALGVGISLVPHRVLALYGDRRRVQRFRLHPTYERELCVVVRKSRTQTEPLASFIRQVLF